MKTIRQNPITKTLAIVMAIAIMNISWTPMGSINDKPEHIMKNSDGETLFKGIVFGEGNVGEILYGGHQINTINKYLGDTPKEIAQTKQSILTFVKDYDSNYFKNFKSVINSGNHFKIKKELKALQNILTNGFNSEVESHHSLTYNKDECVAFIIVVLVAVVLVIPAKRTETQSNLQIEQLVNKIANYNV